MSYLNESGLTYYHKNKLMPYLTEKLDDVKPGFIGTQAEVDAAIAAGTIKENTLVYITDDYDESGSGEIVVSYNYFLAHETEIRATGKTYYVYDGDDGSIIDDTSVSAISAWSSTKTSTELNKKQNTTDNTLTTTSKNVVGAINEITSNLSDLNSKLATLVSHNVPRLVMKDITSYYEDGSLWKRLTGTDGYSYLEDIYVGDYFKMSRPISAYNQDQTYQATGSQYVTIGGINTLRGNGDNISMDYDHLVMIAGAGEDGTQHFGRSRMNPSHTTVGGYAGSEMYTTTIGDVTTSGYTATTATINQQLYAEFGSHLKTTRELLSKSINASGYNRFGTNNGCSNNWDWYSCQAVLMSEVEAYGSTVWSSSGYDTGTAKSRLPLFSYSTKALNNRGAYYWLKDVASSSCFCYCADCGYAGYLGAGDGHYYVRPRFVIA